MSAFYQIDFDQFASDFVPWFLREYGFEYYEGDFKLGNTNDQDVRFITQARNGHFYQYIRLGVGLDKFLNANINKQKLNKEIRKNLEYDDFRINEILIVTVDDVAELGIIDQELIALLEQDKYVISIDVSRTNSKDGILLTRDNSGSFVKFLQAAMTGLNYLNNIFYTYIIEKKEELKYNGQIINISKRLNDVFDNDLRRIYIANVATIPVQYIWRVSEFETPYVYRMSESSNDSFIVGRTAEIDSDIYDFIVFIPVSLTYNNEQMNAIINKYKLVDKTFNIQTY